MSSEDAEVSPNDVSCYIEDVPSRATSIPPPIVLIEALEHDKQSLAFHFKQLGILRWSVGRNSHCA